MRYLKDVRGSNDSDTMFIWCLATLVLCNVLILGINYFVMVLGLYIDLIVGILVLLVLSSNLFALVPASNVILLLSINFFYWYWYSFCIVPRD